MVWGSRSTRRGHDFFGCYKRPSCHPRKLELSFPLIQAFLAGGIAEAGRRALQGQNGVKIIFQSPLKKRFEDDKVDDTAGAADTPILTL